MALTLPFGIQLSRPRVPAVPMAPTTVAVPVMQGQANDYEEIGAVGTLNYTGFLDAEEYNPDLQGLKAIDAYRKMLADGTVKGMVRALTLPLRATTVEVDPASDDPADVAIAEVVKFALLNMDGQSWDDFERQALEGAFVYGHSAFEPVYSKPDGEPNMVDYEGKTYLLPYKLAPRLQKTLYRWISDRFGELKAIQQLAYVPGLDPNVDVQAGDTSGGFSYGYSGSYHYIDIPVDRLVLFSFDREGANFLGTSVLRSAYKHHWYKDNLMRILAVGLERHLVGVPYAIVKQGIATSEKNAIISTMSHLRSHEKAYALFSEAQLPKGSDISMDPIGFLDMPAIGANVTAASNIVQYHDRQMLVSILADFLSLGSGQGGHANVMSRDKTNYFFLALEGFGKAFTDTLQQQHVKKIVDLNFPGVTKYPHVRLAGLENKNINETLTALAQIIQVGGIIPDAQLEDTLREMTGMPPLPLDADGMPMRTEPPAPVVSPNAGAAADGMNNPGDELVGPDPKKLAEPEPAAVVALRKRLAAQLAANAAKLQDAEDEYDEEDFVNDGQSALRKAYLAAFLLAAGSAAARRTTGPNGEEFADQASQRQMDYLRGFARDVQGLTTNGQALTPDAIAARADLYTGGVWTGYQRGNVATMEPQSRIVWHSEGDATTCDLCAERDGQEYSEDTLPGYPGEGGFGDLCDGAANCRCWLEEVAPSEMTERPTKTVRYIERDENGLMVRITEEKVPA